MILEIAIDKQQFPDPEKSNRLQNVPRGDFIIMFNLDFVKT